MVWGNRHTPSEEMPPRTFEVEFLGWLPLYLGRTAGAKRLRPTEKSWDGNGEVWGAESATAALGSRDLESQGSQIV